MLVPASLVPNGPEYFENIQSTVSAVKCKAQLHCMFLDSLIR